MPKKHNKLGGTDSPEGGDATQKDPWRIWKLLSGIVVNILLFVALPLILDYFGLMAPLNAKATWILFITAVGLTLKMILGDMISGGFYYQRHGYDLCIITLGASLTSLSLQLTTRYDLFSGLPKASLLAPIESLTTDIIQQRMILLFGIFLFACILSLATAYIGKAIRDDKPKGVNSLSCLSFALGSLIFGANILILVTKG